MDGTEEDDSDDEETGVPPASASVVSSIPQHIMDTWESCSSSSSLPQTRAADSGLPQHIMDTWASCSSSSSSSSSSSAGSSEFSEDSEGEGATRSSEETRVLSARREVLHQAEEVGFMASLSDLKKGVATKGKRIGGGGSGEVFELEVVDRDLRDELLSFTVGAGVVLKKFNKVSAMVHSSRRQCLR